jgi:transposase
MEGELYMDVKSRGILEEFHRACIDKKTADRIKAILLIADGFTYQQIERILLLDERTLNRYKSIYRAKGIDGLVANNYQGRQNKISDEEIEILKRELRTEIYSTAESICKYVRKTIGGKYSVKGMVQLLHRIGFSYKKTTIVPGKADIEQQERFVKTYEKRYKRHSKEEKVYFLDGCHPTYNNHAGYAWIEKGSRFDIKSNDGRQRINILGAYEPKTAEEIIGEYETLNQEAVIDFLKRLSKRNVGIKIHLICDNARYFYAKAVREKAEEMGIKMIYLPEYSPNLNLIERYWGYLRKKVMTNKYYETFEQFRNAIITFSRNKSKKKKSELLNYIPEKFHLLKPVFT